MTTDRQYAERSAFPDRAEKHVDWDIHISETGVETLVFRLKPLQTGIIIEDRINPGALKRNMTKSIQ